ncbi:metalloregulator ArsR/SmtB family transcription factor [Woodsholea maritima]|uniref:metalloregulator ArsR/SmtB family transcription factor n=1 Tax=Woodsholea maritima TaxID=240237 RepID=UPI000376C686|nr:metalloregulator ArsR/SmtB family transcription factor [Woodsholea maritima]
MPSATTPPDLQDHLANLARAIAHPHRLSLLDALIEDESAVEALATRVGLSLANASQHLQQLKRAQLVQTRREGKQVFYRLGDGPVFEMLCALRDMGSYQRQQRASLLPGHGESQVRPLEGISRRDLHTRLSEGDVIMLDVRPEAEYAEGHIPGAINIPLEELRARLSELPRDQDIVAYCRGPYCRLSVEAVAALKGAGRTAKRLTTGYYAYECS